jgi:hypothetical protein
MVLMPASRCSFTRVLQRMMGPFHDCLVIIHDSGQIPVLSPRVTSAGGFRLCRR